MQGGRFIFGFEQDEEGAVSEWTALNLDSTDVVSGRGFSTFFDFLTSQDHATFYALNLKDTGVLLVPKLFKLGLKWSHQNFKNSFGTFISGTGEWFNITIRYNNFVRILDASKFVKGAKNISPDLFECLSKTKELLAKALSYKPDASTMGQVILDDFRKQAGASYRSNFPYLDAYTATALREAYFGGWVYLNPTYQNVSTGQIIELDKNSMYPTMLKTKKMPAGRPIWFDGKAPAGSLAIQEVQLDCKLKEGMLPVLRFEKYARLASGEPFVYETDGLQPFALTLDELELVKDHYDIEIIRYLGGWKFRDAGTLFADYIDKWTDIKVEAKKSGDKATYKLAKLFLNGLVGKFASKPFGRESEPYIASNGVLKLKELGTKALSQVYAPVSIFVNAYARCDLVRTIERMRALGFKKYARDVFVYSDTDSIYTNLAPDDLDELGLDIDPVRLGAWKLEGMYQDAKFVKTKEYITLDTTGLSHATIAGLPKKYADQLKFADF